MGPKTQTEFWKSVGKVVTRNFLVSSCDHSFAICEDPGGFWRGGFPISKQLPPAEQGKARRVGWVMPMATMLGPVGHTGLSAGVEGGPLAIPSAMKCPQESLEQSIFATNHHFQQSRDCSAVPGQARSPSMQGVLHNGMLWATLFLTLFYKRN